jgi:hypothetical protein
MSELFIGCGARPQLTLGVNLTGGGAAVGSFYKARTGDAEQQLHVGPMMCKPLSEDLTTSGIGIHC